MAKNRMMAKAKGKSLDQPSAVPMASDKKWQAESDMRTLASSAEIIADKARHKAAQECAKKEMGKLKRVCK